MRYNHRPICVEINQSLLNNIENPFFYIMLQPDIALNHINVIYSTHLKLIISSIDEKFKAMKAGFQLEIGKQQAQTDTI